MAQVTTDMCEHIIAAAQCGERFPLTVNEMQQLAHLAMLAMLAVAPDHPATAVDAEDAARYRLIRRKVCIAGGQFHVLNLHPRYVAPDAAIELDAAIDAMRASEVKAKFNQLVEETRAVALASNHPDTGGDVEQPESAPTDKEIREEFERQHRGRNLNKHHMRGTYTAPQIAALWNQHVRTVKWMQERDKGPTA